MLQGKLIRWKIGTFIGAGSYGQVFRAMEVDTGRIIAVKKLPVTGPVSDEVWNSIEVMSFHLISPNDSLLEGTLVAK